MHTRVFFRDDDMGPLLEPLQAVMQVLREASVPCSYEVVPQALTTEVAQMALAERAQAPELIAFHQHGLRHHRIVDGQVDHAEFAGGRSLQDQERDIRSGREMLRDKLGDALDGDVFTPPCHKCDANTLRALENVGIRTLSAGVQTDLAARMYYRAGRMLRRVDWLGRRVSYHGGAIPGTALRELSTCVDFDLYQGAACSRSIDEQWRRFSQCRRVLGIVGINLHHACYTEQGKIDTLRAFVQRLRQTDGVVLCSMKELCAGMGGAV